MCVYRYIYYAACQHAEFTCMSYCEKAITLGIPQRDNLYRQRHGTSCPQSRSPIINTPQHADTLDNYYYLHPQHHQDMATLTPSQARSVTASWTGVREGLSHPRPGHAALISRSAQADIDAVRKFGDEHTLEFALPSDPIMDAPYCDQVNIDMPLQDQTVISMKVIQHKAPAPCQVNVNERHFALAASPCAEQKTVRASPNSQRARHSLHDTVKEEHTSPRKSLPAQWKGPPQLRTAQRAQARESRKRASEADSPTDLTFRTHFPTKDMPSAVDVDNTTPTSPLLSSPSKLRPSPSKSALKSADSSPRGSPGRSQTVRLLLSPTRLFGSSVAPSSQSDTPFVAARQSPVSSCPNSQPQNPAKVPERSGCASAQDLHDRHMAELELADAERRNRSDSEVSRSLSRLRGKSDPHVKFAAAGKALTKRTSAPKLSVKVSTPISRSSDRRSPRTIQSATSLASDACYNRPSQLPRTSASVRCVNSVNNSWNQVAISHVAPLTGSPTPKVGTLEDREEPSLGVKEQLLPNRSSAQMDSNKNALLEELLVKTVPIAEPVDKPDASPTCDIEHAVEKPVQKDFTDTIVEDSHSAVMSKSEECRSSGLQSIEISGHGRSEIYPPQSRRQIHSEHSMQSSHTSDLRANAAEFVPQARRTQGSEVEIPFISAFPPQWSQPPETLPFNIFATDIYGWPFYNYMYEVQLGPGTPYDFTDPKSMFPKRKGRGKKVWGSNGNRRANTKSASNHESNHYNVPQDMGDLQSHINKAASQQLHGYFSVLPSDVTSHTISNTSVLGAASVDSTPFANQYAQVSSHREEGGYEKSRWDSYLERTSGQRVTPFPSNAPGGNPPLSRVPDRNRTNFSHTSSNTLPRTRRTREKPNSGYQGGNGLYYNPNGNYHGRHQQVGAGLPIDDTIPFPDPRPPHVGSNCKGYVGYTIGVPAEKTQQTACGNMTVESAEEMLYPGIACHACDDKHAKAEG